MERIVASNEEVIREFLKVWSTLDVEKITTFFTDDGTYHNMPVGPVSGRDNLRDFITNFTKDWTETVWDVKNVIADGDIVVAERVDKTKMGHKAVDLPCLGIFEMENGRIKVWRDYFDLGTYMKAYE